MPELVIGNEVKFIALFHFATMLFSAWVRPHWTLRISCIAIYHTLLDFGLSKQPTQLSTTWERMSDKIQLCKKTAFWIYGLRRWPLSADYLLLESHYQRLKLYKWETNLFVGMLVELKLIWTCNQRKTPLRFERLTPTESRLELGAALW